MPYNRVNSIKETSFWNSFLANSFENDRNIPEDYSEDSPKLIRKKDGFSEITSPYSSSYNRNESSVENHFPGKSEFRNPFPLISENYLKYWFPGLLVIPNPEVGFIFGYVDISFLAVLCYLFGSILYVVDAFLCWKRVNPSYSDDYYNAAIYLNTYAAGIFVLNCFFCFLDWYLQIQQLNRNSLNSNESIYYQQKEKLFENQSSSKKNLSSLTTIPPMILQRRKFDEEEHGSIINHITFDRSYYYHLSNNFFFLLGAMLFLFQGILLQDKRLDSFQLMQNIYISFAINLTGGIFYLISSLFSCIESFEDRLHKELHGLPNVYLFTTKIEEVDWFGWGDVLYFLASISSIVQAFFTLYEISEDFNAVFYIGSNCAFFIDSVIYLIGYLVYLRDLRNSIFTGKVPAIRTISLSQIIAEDENIKGFRECDQMLPSSPSFAELHYPTMVEPATPPSTPSVGNNSNRQPPRPSRNRTILPIEKGFVQIKDIQSRLKLSHEKTKTMRSKSKSEGNLLPQVELSPIYHSPDGNTTTLSPFHHSEKLVASPSISFAFTPPVHGIAKKIQPFNYSKVSFHEEDLES